MGMEGLRALNRQERREVCLELVRKDPEGFVEMFLDLLERVEVLEDRVKELETQLSKNSRNSSKPPSSDGYQKPAPRSLRRASGKKPGGQPGRAGSTLEKVAHPDHLVEHKLECCPHSGVWLGEGDIVGSVSRQIFELPQPRLEVTEHRVYQYRVPGTGRIVQAEFPAGVTAAVQYGSRFKSWLVYLGDFQLLPTARIGQMCADLFGYTVSEATIGSARSTCFANLDHFEHQSKERLASSELLHSDESGMRVNGKLHWFHVASNDQDTSYHVHPKRGTEAMTEAGILPHFGGAMVHDFWKSYFRFEGVRHALCNSHLLRELQALIETGQSWARDMKAMLLAAHRDGGVHKLESWHRRYQRILKRGYRENQRRRGHRKRGQRGRLAQPAAINLLDRFRDYRADILRFLAEPLVPFTNNQAEQDIRMIKVQQKISGGFRTLQGARSFARIRSYISTARKRQASVLDALHHALLGQPDFC